MSPNFAAEQRIGEVLKDGGVRPTAVEDFIEDFRDGKFIETGIDAYVKKMREEKPHRFFADDPLETQAFQFGSVTAQGAYERKYGHDAAVAAAERYQNPFAQGVIGKPSLEPAAEKEKRLGGAKHETNPFANVPANVDSKGRYTAKALTAQGGLVKSIGVEKAAGIARAVGAKLGDVYAPKIRQVA